MTDTSEHAAAPTYPDDEIDLLELFQVLWSGKWLIGAITGFAAGLSVVVALMLPNIYTGSALLAPASDSGGSMRGLMQQYAGLASLAGVTLPGGDEASQAQLGMEMMTSRAFIGDFVERRNLLPDLLAFESWNRATGKNTYNSEAYDSESGEWVRDVEPPKQAKPSLLEAHEAFLGILTVSQDKQTGYVTVSVAHQSPDIAARWVNWLVEDINAAVRAQDVDEANRSIEYLKQQVASTSLAELQAMFFELIQSQTQTVMLAQVRPEYVFKTIDPAVVPEKKSKPQRALICVLGTLLGGMLAVVIVLLRHYTRSDSEA